MYLLVYPVNVVMGAAICYALKSWAHLFSCMLSGILFQALIRQAGYDDDDDDFYLCTSFLFLSASDMAGSVHLQTIPWWAVSAAVPYQQGRS